MQLEFEDYELNVGDVVEFKGMLQRIVFPTGDDKILGEGTNTYGITSWKLTESLADTYIPSRLTLVGEFYEPLDPDEVYHIKATVVFHEKYGYQYKLINIYTDLNINDPVTQKRILKRFLTPLQIRELYNIFNNPLIPIEEEDIESLKRVKGIGEATAKAICRRFKEKSSKLRLYSSLGDLDLTDDFLNKCLRHFGDERKVIGIIRETPYRLMEMDGVGFKKADAVALKVGISPKSIERIGAYIGFYLSEQAESGNSYMYLSEVIEAVYLELGEGDKYNILEEYEEGSKYPNNVAHAISKCEELHKIVIEKKNGVNDKRSRVYLPYYYNLEKKIAAHLMRLNSGFSDAFVYDNAQQYIDELQEKNGWQFTKEQLDGIYLGLKSQVCLISGLAGAGKSSLVAGILAGLKDSSITIAQCALSGKAAARLQEVTNSPGLTIHRLLGYKLGEFTYNYQFQLPYNVIILDEVSLVGGEIFLDLIQAIPTGSKLIMLGDLGQLEAIGALNLAADLFESAKIPTVELKQVHRQSAQSGIISASHKIRNQEQLFSPHDSGNKVYGEKKDMCFDLNETNESIITKTIGWFKKAYDSSTVNGDPMKIQLISPVRERGESCVGIMNMAVQDIVNPYTNQKRISIKDGKFEYYIKEGDKIMCIKNCYETMYYDKYNPEHADLTDKEKEQFICPIFNGWTGIIKEITDNLSVVVDFPYVSMPVVIPYDTAVECLVLGYASTVHKLQGSDAPVVIGAVDYSTPPLMLTCQLLYTLITRAKSKCVIVGQTPALCKAISTNKVSSKRTFLKEMLELDDFELERYLAKAYKTEQQEGYDKEGEKNNYLNFSKIIMEEMEKEAVGS